MNDSNSKKELGDTHSEEIDATHTEQTVISQFASKNQETQKNKHPVAMIQSQSGKSKGKLWILQSSSTALIGRSLGAQISIDDSFCSRRQCTLHIEADNKVFITDLGSTNRTYVNGKSLTPNQRFELGSGDLIRIGSTVELGFALVPELFATVQHKAAAKPGYDVETGLVAHNQFEAYLDREIALQMRNGAQTKGRIGLILVSLDNLKTLRLYFGNQICEEALKILTDKITMINRKESIISRLEDATLAVGLRNISIEGLSLFTQRLCRTLEEKVAVKTYHIAFETYVGGLYVESTSQDITRDSIVASCKAATQEAKANKVKFVLR